MRGNTLFRITDVCFTNPDFDADTWQQLAELPHRFGLQLDGPSVTDETLTHLVNINPLKYVVFNNSNVSEGAIVELQRKRPDITVMIGYPGDPGFEEYRSVAQ